MSTPVRDWVPFRDLTLDEARRRFHGAEEGDVAYEGLRDVTALHDADVHPGHFYFRDGRLAMLYTNTRSLDVDERELRDWLGEPEAELRSRAGKRFAQAVYPDQGVSFSSDGETVAFVEIFPPTTLERYKQEIYKDPQAFVK